MKLPAPGSLYYDYLCSVGVGECVSLDLQPDADNLEDEDRALCLFTIKKVANDKWLGLPTKIGSVGTMIVFEHVLDMMEGEDSIVVFHGQDPRKIKKEQVEQGVEEPTIKFFSINQAIEVNTDDEDELIDCDLAGPSKRDYEKVYAANAQRL